MRSPLVSVIVTTRNNHETLEACLRSINAQTYKNSELLVVDNNSTDDTKIIAWRFTRYVYNHGPERSAQRNYGATKANGDYVLIIDSDMELGPQVVQSCIDTIDSDHVGAAIIPEESFGLGFWAQCKRLERSFYVGIDAIEAARFFGKKLYQKIGGYNETMTGGEDWDFTNRIRAVAKIGRSRAYIYHNEGRLRFMRTVRKMHYYAWHATAYFDENPTTSALTDHSGPLARYKLFLSKPGHLFKNPFLGFGVLALKTTEYISGGLGYAQAKWSLARKQRAKEEA